MVVWQVLGAIITLLLIFVLPGLALFKSRLFGEFRLHWVAKVLFIVAVSASITSLVALGLAEAGYLRIWLLDLVMAAVTIATRLIFGYTGRQVFLGARRREVLAVVALVIIGAGLFFRPFEAVMGDGDPGYYFNMGYHLAATGEMTIYDKSIPAMSDKELKTFYQRDINQFLPLHLRVREKGKVQPLLYHLLPVWIGIFIVIFGTWGGLFVVPLLMLLSVMAVYALVRRYTGPVGAAAAAFLMEFCFLAIYFARLPVSEAGCQFFMLASLLFFAEFMSTKGPATGLASAGAATVAFAFRPEALILALPMLIVEGVEVFKGKFKTGDIVFTNALLAGLLYNWFYMRFVGYFYLFGNMRKVFSVFGAARGLNIALDLFLGSIVLTAVLFNLPFLRRLCARVGSAIGRASGPLRAKAPDIVACAMAALTLLVFVYLYAFTPTGKIFVESSKKFFFYTAGYFGGISVFVFVVGLCLYIYRSRRTGFSFVLAATVIGLAAAFAESGVTSGYQPWLTRRFMTLVVPALFVGFGYLAGRLWDSKRAYRMAAAGLAFALLLAFFIYLDVPLFNFVQYKGVNAKIGSLAQKVDGDLVIFTDPFEGEAIGMPLRYQYGKDARRAYTLDDSVDFVKTVRDYTARGKKVLIETKGLATLMPAENLLDELSFTKAFDADVSFERLGQSYKVVPRHIGEEKHDITFYYVTPKSAQ